MSQHQRKLDEYIADAEEWAAAKDKTAHGGAHGGRKVSDDRGVVNT